jgi:hypothetical protein
MALWVCGGEGGCGTKYAVGLSRCPRCHNTKFFEDGDPMAKISRYGGASDKTLPAPEPESDAAAETVPTPEAAADQPEIASPADVMSEAGAETGEGLAAGLPEPSPEGGESSSPGSSSSASTGAQQTNSEPSSKPTPKRARKTASRFGQGRTESSSAPSTDGGRETGTSAADDE